MIAVLGAGNWGTTLADFIASNGHAVRLWTRQPEQREEINARHTNEGAVPGLRIAEGVSATSELGEAVRGAEALGRDLDELRAELRLGPEPRYRPVRAHEVRLAPPP